MSIQALAKFLAYFCGGTQSTQPGDIDIRPMTDAGHVVYVSSCKCVPGNNISRNIFIIGAPGAGKGTQSAFLVEHFGLEHLSYGDLMRRLKETGDPVVSRLNTKPGTNNPIVSNDLSAWLIWREIREGTREGKRSWLVDGFPRRVEQVDEWLELIAPADLTLYLRCPIDVSAQRVASRGEKAGAEARPEDLDPTVAARRIAEFYKNADIVVAKLKDRGIEVVEVDTNRSEMEIQRDLEKIMEARMSGLRKDKVRQT